MSKNEPIISYAQNGEDILLYRALKDVKEGFYVDIGAWEPELDSVTKLFYDLGWSGINIEPNSESYERLCSGRERDINLKIAVGDEEKFIDFFMFRDTGLSTSLNESAELVAADRNLEITKVIIEQKTLNSVLEAHCTGKEIHFLKLDVEGSEFSILKDFNFSNFKPWIIVVETIYPVSFKKVNFNWDDFFKKNNYEFAQFDGINSYYVESTRSEILELLRDPVNTTDNFVTIYQNNLEKALEVARVNHESMEAQINKLSIRNLVRKGLSKPTREDSEAKDAMLATMREELEAKNAAFATMREELEAKNAALEQVYTENSFRENQLNAILESEVWLSTKPIRFTIGWVRRLLRNYSILIWLRKKLEFFYRRYPKVGVFLVRFLSKSELGIAFVSKFRHQGNFSHEAEYQFKKSDWLLDFERTIHLLLMGQKK